MKWPWVSREAYDERGRSLASALADLERLRVQLEHAVGAPWPRVERQDGSLVSVPALQFPAPPRPIDPVKRAIRDQVRANPDMRGLESYLSQYAADLRALHNKNPGEIADLLTRWESSEAMSAPVDSVVPIDTDEAVA